MSYNFASTDPVSIAELTQQLRLRKLAEITENGTKIGDLKEFMALTRELDSTALLSRKLNIEEAEKDEASQIARDMIAIMQAGGGRMPEIKDVQGEVINAPKADPARLPTIRKVPGHTDVDVPELNIDDFYNVKKKDE